MKLVKGVCARMIFYVFVLAILGWTATLTLSLIQTVLPGDPITPFFGLALFDGGAMAWLLVFLYYAKGLSQRAISILLMIFDLVGVVVMSASELFMGGQTFTEVPANLGTLVIWAVGIWTAINAIAIYLFHVNSPEASKAIELQSEMDKLEGESLEQAKGRFQEKAAAIGARLADRLEREVLYSFRLVDAGGEYIDADACDVETQQATVKAKDKPKFHLWPKRDSKRDNVPPVSVRRTEDELPPTERSGINPMFGVQKALPPTEQEPELTLAMQAFIDAAVNAKLRQFQEQATSAAMPPTEPAKRGRGKTSVMTAPEPENPTPGAA